MKEKGNQLFRDKFVLVMLVLGLLTIVAAAGVVRIQKGRENIEKSPYLEIEDPEHVIQRRRRVRRGYFGRGTGGIKR